MKTFTPDEYAWASTTALRLRIEQADDADRPDEERQRNLDQEIGEALKRIDPAQRARYLQALAAHFPAGFITAPKSVDAPVADNSPEALVDALVKIARQLPTSLRADFGLRLQEAGYMVIKSTTQADCAPPEELTQLIPLDPEQPVDTERLYRALAIFAKYYLGLERIVWGTWQKMAPDSPVRKEGGAAADLRKLTAFYLQGDTEVSSSQLQAMVEKTRKVMAGLLGAIPAGSEAFFERFNAAFAPDKIEALAKADPKISGFTQGDKNWKKYKQMMNDQQGQVFEEKMLAAIARRAEQLMEGTSRKET